ncbi:MAG: type I-E CRISPR-associated protein Cse1/CasA [Panacagrimonas sp.]
MNLINDRWLPVIRAQGYERIAPREIADIANPVLRLAATRPDFNASLMQFLIGLVQTACAPTGQQDWITRYLAPPTPDQLGVALEPFAPYFELDGDGIRFMQDFAQLELAEQEPNDIAALLIDAPGEQSTKFNKDLFVKRGGAAAVCESCAAAMLLTLQTNAPAGGAGHNTSLRGGGPLTTFVAVTSQGDLLANLWRAVWLNVLEQEQLGPNHPDAAVSDPGAVFPWASPARTSEDSNGAARKAAKKSGGDAPEKQRRQITYADGHPLWVYWATPRRIVLDFDVTDAGACDLCGENSERRLHQYRTRNYGANYTSGWLHPLSPYYRQKPTDAELMPQHPKGGMSYRDWLGLVGSTSPTRQRAMVVSEFVNRRREALARHLRNPKRLPFRLHACGYDMDNMKPLCWHESLMPLPSVDSTRIEDVVQRWIDGAQSASKFLRDALKEAWFSPGATVRGDFGFVTDAYWQSTEDEFYALLDVLSEASTAARASDEALLSTYLRWHRVLRDKALHLFEQHAESGPAEQGNAKRVALARHQLVLNLGGRKLKEALGIPVDAPASAARKSRSRGAGVAASAPTPAAS